MKTSIAAAAVAASVTAGGIAGALLAAPSLVSAAETTTSAIDWVDEALSGLVDDGTITQQQADAVESALEEARPERGFGFGRFGHHLGLSVVAETLGITEDQLRSALAGGQSIADIAAADGVDVRAVVDAVVAEHREHLDEAVAEGDLTQEEADELQARAENFAAAVVNGELPAFRRGFRPHAWPGHGSLDGDRTEEGGDTARGGAGS